MGRKKIPGLQKRQGVWIVDKVVFGKRICESTGTDSLAEAEKYLAHLLERERQAVVYGVRPKRIFREAATKYLLENEQKTTLAQDALWLKCLDKTIGDLPLEAVHMGSLQSYIAQRKKEGVKYRTINYPLQVTRRVLNLAASEWLDDHGLTWLAHAPKIKLLPEHDKRKPYPLSWDEQHRLIQALPEHLAKMALFAANTGCRDQEICSLRWEWEVHVNTEVSVFIVPGACVKNREDRLIVLNSEAQSVIESVRRIHSEYVFTYRNRRIHHMMNSGWKKARQQAGLPQVRVHDLKHTFGRRLRAAGVNFEDRQDLLGHKSGRITTHYSAAEINNLIESANKACRNTDSTVTLTVLKLNREMPAGSL